VREALTKAGREDLIGFDSNCLVKPDMRVGSDYMNSAKNVKPTKKTDAKTDKKGKNTTKKDIKSTKQTNKKPVKSSTSPVKNQKKGKTSKK
jgi:hypothetical protein